MQCATPQARVRAVQTHAPDKYEKNCSLSILSSAADQTPQKSLKGAITYHHIA